MAPRSSWKGFIKLSLVSVPVKAYTATVTSSEIRLNQLHEECKNRVKYQKTCPVHGEISNDEIVSRYEFSKGQYVVVDLDELSKLRAQGDKSVNVDGFIDPEAIDPIYFTGKTYYLVPDGPVGQKPYALLHDAMVESNVHGIAQIIIAGRENLVVLRPHKNMLCMNVVSYPAKVKVADAFKDEIVETAIAKEERTLAKTLVDASKIEEFDFGSYKDEYVEKLSTLIQSKVEGKEIVAVSDPEEPQIINLMEALKASVAKAQGSPAAKKTSKKMAPSAGGRKPATKKKSG